MQGFSAHRIYILSSQWIIPVIAWVLCFLRFTSLLTLAVICHGTLNLMASKEEWEWLFVITLIFSTSNDVLITVSLCYYLWTYRGGTLARMKTIIDKLILWTIQTGLITSCGTTIQLILFLVLDNYGWLAIFLIVPRLFSNSLMASLNARADLRSINEASGLDSNLNFDLQSTRQTRISIAMTSVREQRHADVELGKPHGADFGLTEITPHATKREWK
ncbi:hypothetical protein H2248_004221 [Termitomyces sp. 'cryptogamus']|nr:hypothetical protein H2248_004221 [Termitomyces sp. 'cryptogamus']